jgi:hypothetical protein
MIAHHHARGGKWSPILVRRVTQLGSEWWLAKINSRQSAENPIEVDAVSSLRKMNVISFPIQFALISKRDLCFAGERSSNGMQRSVRAVSRTAPSFV